MQLTNITRLYYYRSQFFSQRQTSRPRRRSLASTRNLEEKLCSWLCTWVSYWPDRGWVFECVTCLYFFAKIASRPRKPSCGSLRSLFVGRAKTYRAAHSRWDFSTLVLYLTIAHEAKPNGAINPWPLRAKDLIVLVSPN